VDTAVLVGLLLDAPAERLARTREAQLAILLTSLVAWEAVRGSIPPPVAFAGHSLGQVTALIAAGVVGLDDGVRFAARRAELTQNAADARPGRMAALLGTTVDVAREACLADPPACWVANDNAPGQIVIAGTPEGVDAAVARAKELGVRKAMPLNVGGAFHTPLMQDAADELVTVLADLPLADASVPVVANDDGEAHADGEGWRARSATHVAVPVRWREAQLALAELGATSLLEVGHGSMLAALAKRTLPDVVVTGVATPDDVATVASPA
jgi:[acyl-carrier-protein] S-malonyltransferase